MSHPAVRRYINRCVTGDRNVWPLDWFLAQRFVTDVAHAVSIGCGLGNFERALSRSGLAQRITGIDLHESLIEQSRASAVQEGLANIRYEAVDAERFLESSRPLDAIFFHASLHHFPDPDRTLALCVRKLRPGGIVYLDEFVGRSMGQWRPWHLIVPNLVHRSLSKESRRVRLIRTPINPDDPSEAIASAEILPAVRRHFRVMAQKDYWGNLVSLIYPNLRLDSPLLDRDVERLIEIETWFSALPRRLRPSSFHSVVVAVAK